MKQDVKSLMREIRLSSVFRQEVATEAISGWPALHRKGKNVYMMVPYYILDKVEKGKTLINPPVAIITIDCKDGKIMEYCNTQYRDYIKSDGKPLGVFPHDEIAKLPVKEYKDLKVRVFDLYNILLECLINGSELDSKTEKEFSKHLKLLIEPSLRSFYLAAAPKFFEYFLNSNL